MAAENTLIIDVEVGNLKTQLRESVKEMQSARAKFGEFSDQAVIAAKNVARVRDEIDAGNEAAKLFDPGSRFQALTTAASTAAGGVAAVQGAMALFGAESEDVGKALMKVQGAMAFSQGLSQLKDIGKVGEQLIMTYRGVTLGLSAMQKALIATGIGALVVAVGLIAAYWEEITGAINGVSKEQKDLNKLTQENLDAENEKLSAIDEQSNILKLQGKTEKEILQLKIAQSEEAIKVAEINLLNAENQKATQIEAATRNRDILRGMIQMVSIPITALLVSIDMVGKAFGKNFGLEKGFSEGLANMVFDPKETEDKANKTIEEAKKGLDKLKNQQAGYKLAIQEIDKTEADKKTAAKSKQDEIDKKKREDDLANEKAFQAELARVKSEAMLASIKDQDEKAIIAIQESYKLQYAAIDANEKYTAEQRLALKKSLEEKEKAELNTLKENFELKQLDAEIQKLTDEQSQANLSFGIQKDLIDKKQALLDQELNTGLINDEEYTKASKANTDARIELAKKESQAKIDMANAIAGSLSIVSDIIGKESVAGKAIAVASALINTYLGISAGVKLGYPAAIPAVLAAAATGFKSVKSILATKIPTKSGGDGGGGASMSAPAVTSMMPTLGNAPVTSIADVMQTKQAPIRAFVVESEVTSSQKRVSDIERRAGF